MNNNDAHNAFNAYMTIAEEMITYLIEDAEICDTYDEAHALIVAQRDDLERGIVEMLNA